MCTQRKRPNEYSQKRAVCKSGREVSGDIKPVHILMMDLQTPVHFSSVQSLSPVWFFETPWTAVHQASLSITNSWSLLKLTSIESVMPSSHLILCHPLLLPPSIFPSIRDYHWSSEWQYFSIGCQAHIARLSRHWSRGWVGDENLVNQEM